MTNRSDRGSNKPRGAERLERVDLIRDSICGLHQGQQPWALREQAEHMDAPDRCSSLYESSCTAGAIHTWDRGKELADHRRFTLATKVHVYFCDPQNPWQRGTNENTNRLPRQYLPHGVDLSTFTQAQLSAIARQLNERPRKTLNYLTPAETFAQAVASTEPATTCRRSGLLESFDSPRNPTGSFLRGERPVGYRPSLSRCRALHRPGLSIHKMLSF